MRARRRRWAAGVAALALAASSGVAVVVWRGGSDDRAAPSAARAYPTVPARGAPREPSAIPPAGRSPSERAALEAARRFLAGYLPYSYGQASASQIRGAAAPLARTLRRQPPRVAAGERELEPQLVALEVASVNGDLGFDLAATIDDGRRRYAMTVAVRAQGERWLVVALS
jgi:hypothetical protein